MIPLIDDLSTTREHSRAATGWWCMARRSPMTPDSDSSYGDWIVTLNRGVSVD